MKNETIKNRKSSVERICIEKKHYSFSRKVVCNPDCNYLNITKEKAKKIIDALNAGGSATLTIDKFNTVECKRNGNIEKKYVVSINGLKKLGFRNKKAKVYRYKILGNYSTINKIAKNSVLFTRLGGKGKFENKFDEIHNQMELKNEKLDFVVDAFFGGGGYTLKNIEKLNFKNYIINDLDPLVINTMNSVKENYTKVINYFNKINSEYLALIPAELKEKKISKELLTKLRKKHFHIKDYYKNCIKKLDKLDELDKFEAAAIYIFIMNRTSGGFFNYRADNTIDDTNFNHSYTERDKTNMILYWAYLLNKHNVQIRQEDVFDLLKDKSIVDKSLVYLDPPYFSDTTVINYNQNSSDDFQVKLLELSNRFNFRIYSNEECETLYKLKIDKYFDNSISFFRANNPGNNAKIKKEIGMEYLAYNILNKNNNYINSVNNINYEKEYNELLIV